MDPKLIVALKTEALRMSQGNLSAAKEILTWFLEETYAELVVKAKQEASKDGTSI